MKNGKPFLDQFWRFLLERLKYGFKEQEYTPKTTSVFQLEVVLFFMYTICTIFSLCEMNVVAILLALIVAVQLHIDCLKIISKEKKELDGRETPPSLKRFNVIILFLAICTGIIIGYTCAVGFNGNANGLQMLFKIICSLLYICSAAEKTIELVIEYYDAKPICLIKSEL